MRRFLAGFIVGFVIIGIGIPITAVEFLSYNYNEKEYFKDVNYEDKTYTYDVEDKSINIYDIYGYKLNREDFKNIVEDDSMGNEIKLVINYPYELIDLYINAENSNNEMNIYINYDNKHDIRFDTVRKIINDVIEDLKNDNIYSYNKTIAPKVTIYASKDNVNKINM
jgi:hypothetical protein